MSVRDACALTLCIGAACAALVVATAGCGSSGQSGGGVLPSSAPPSVSPPASARPLMSASSVVSPSATGGSAPASPAGGPVPARFKAASVTFVSTQEAFVLGTARPSGTYLLRTQDRGQSWVSLTAPGVPLGRPGAGSSQVVWGTRFATPSHGFVFGVGLWETTDGGRHWTADSQPTGSILSLATIDEQVLALTAQADAQGSFGSASLRRRPLAGGAWSTVATVRLGDLSDPTDLISTQAGVAAVLDGRDVLVTADGGLTVAHRTTSSIPHSLTPTSATALSRARMALLCIGQGYMGHTDKTVYVSADGGVHWTKAGVPGNEGDGGTLGGSGGDLLLATTSAASWIDRSTDGGRTWATPVTYGDGGLGWADLGFTSPSDAVVIHGPAEKAGGAGRPGKLLLSGDGGATWHAVTF